MLDHDSGNLSQKHRACLDYTIIQFSSNYPPKSRDLVIYSRVRHLCVRLRKKILWVDSTFPTPLLCEYILHPWILVLLSLLRCKRTAHTEHLDIIPLRKITV